VRIGPLAGVLLCLGCGARTGLEADGPVAVCGDGIVQAGEACDPGGAAGGVCPSYLVTQNGQTRGVVPVERSRSALAFYSYTSKSAHTGFEALGASRLFLYVDATAGALSLFTEHGIDIDSTGIAQPASTVVQRFTKLPEGTFLAITDDYPKEISMSSPTSAIGTWQFEQNTDGTIFSGLPGDGAFAIDVASDFQVGIDTWTYVDHDGTFLRLELDAVATVERRYVPCGCGPDCTTLP